MNGFTNLIKDHRTLLVVISVLLWWRLGVLESSVATLGKDTFTILLEVTRGQVQRSDIVRRLDRLENQIDKLDDIEHGRTGK